MTHVPVIFMTGLSETEHIVTGFEAGGVDYVTKPINPDELLARIRVHLVNARRAESAQMALDVSGRHLLAVDPAGEVLWCTPQAAKLLGTATPGTESQQHTLPADVRAWLSTLTKQGSSRPFSGPLGKTTSLISYVGTIGPDEILLRLELGQSDEDVLREKLSLTLREAEVLAWIARGKSSRDIGEILSLSPRTVDKHLEQIYAKLGVESRSAAATLAVRTIGRL